MELVFIELGNWFAEISDQYDSDQLYKFNYQRSNIYAINSKKTRNCQYLRINSALSVLENLMHQYRMRELMQNKYVEELLFTLKLIQFDEMIINNLLPFIIPSSDLFGIRRVFNNWILLNNNFAYTYIIPYNKLDTKYDQYLFNDNNYQELYNLIIQKKNYKYKSYKL